eukprot:GHVO01006692.1.p1 GENE.GHVO01006692.1~~GHVO01006692.1.p1  ORF type:complete len:356 (+),score=28.74 GHVO01006692.1:47-1114(+)
MLAITSYVIVASLLTLLLILKSLELGPKSLGTGPVVLELDGPIALIILTHDDISMREWWDYWIQDAYRWAEETHPQIYSNRGPRGFLTFYVHFDSHGRDRVVKVPSYMANDTMTDTEICRWGYTIPCMIRGLEAAVEGRPDELPAAQMIFVSGTSIPVMPFSHIYKSLVDNPRSRFAFCDINLQPHIKHRQWVSLSRYHATVLVDNKETWTEYNDWIEYQYPSGKWNRAAADEHATFATLEKALGRDKALRGINDGSPLPEPDDGSAVRGWVRGWDICYACWSKSCYIGPLGHGTYPAYYDTVNITSYEDILIPTYWFARKFGENPGVVGNPGTKLWTELMHLYVRNYDGILLAD